MGVEFSSRGINRIRNPKLTPLTCWIRLPCGKSVVVPGVESGIKPAIEGFRIGTVITSINGIRNLNSVKTYENESNAQYTERAH